MENQVKVLTLKRHLSDKQAEALKGKFLTDEHYDLLVTEDTDAYDASGKLLLKFRKGVMPFELAKLGYESFKGSISLTEGRGISSGSSHKRVRSDGSISNTTVGNKVFSGAVGFMDPNAMVKYCRKTAFTRDYFEKFKQGIPFVKKVDELYEELCPSWYKKQRAIANATNRNYVIEGTSFTTVTVNKNFQTAVHKDAGDYPEGFGNLLVYREGSYEGAHFCLPEYRVAVEMQTTDILFVDVHRWHGNTPFKNCSEDYLRIAYVLYLREYILQCDQPKVELKKTKIREGGFFKL